MFAALAFVMMPVPEAMLQVPVSPPPRLAFKLAEVEQTLCPAPALAAMLLFEITTELLALQLLWLTVQVKVLFPMPKLFTAVVGSEALLSTPLPLVTVQTPVPWLGLEAFKLVELPQTALFAPADAETALFLMNVLLVALQVP